MVDAISVHDNTYRICSCLHTNRIRFCESITILALYCQHSDKSDFYFQTYLSFPPQYIKEVLKRSCPFSPAWHVSAKRVPDAFKLLYAGKNISSTLGITEPTLSPSLRVIFRKIHAKGYIKSFQEVSAAFIFLFFCLNKSGKYAGSYCSSLDPLHSVE